MEHFPDDDSMNDFLFRKKVVEYASGKAQLIITEKPKNTLFESVNEELASLEPIDISHLKDWKNILRESSGDNHFIVEPVSSSNDSVRVPYVLVDREGCHDKIRKIYTSVLDENVHLLDNIIFDGIEMSPFLFSADNVLTKGEALDKYKQLEKRRVRKDAQKFDDNISYDPIKRRFNYTPEGTRLGISDDSIRAPKHMRIVFKTGAPALGSDVGTIGSQESWKAYKERQSDPFISLLRENISQDSKRINESVEYVAKWNPKTKRHDFCYSWFPKNITHVDVQYKD